MGAKTVNFVVKDIRIYTEVIAMFSAIVSENGFGVSINSKDTSFLNIVFEPHNFVDDNLPNNCVMYNTEPIAKHWSGNKKYGVRWVDLLRRYPTIDYSERNIISMNKMFAGGRRYFLGLGYHKSSLAYKSLSDLDVDVTFIGSVSDRRRYVLEDLRGRGLRVAIIKNKFGSEIYPYLARSKLLLNIHNIDDGRPAEMVRLFHPISNGMLVVSERSVRTEVPEYADGAAIWSEYNELPNIVESIIRKSDDERAEMASKNREFLRKYPMGENLIRIISNC